MREQSDRRTQIMPIWFVRVIISNQCQEQIKCNITYSQVASTSTPTPTNVTIAGPGLNAWLALGDDGVQLIVTTTHSKSVSLLVGATFNSATVPLPKLLVRRLIYCATNDSSARDTMFYQWALDGERCKWKFVSITLINHEDFVFNMMASCWS